jgi:hypothetical protein
VGIILKDRPHIHVYIRSCNLSNVYLRNILQFCHIVELCMKRKQEYPLGTESLLHFTDYGREKTRTVEVVTLWGLITWRKP